MGRSRLIPFVVEYTTNGAYLTPGEYHRKYDGKPGAEGLARHVKMLQESFEPGGVNEHIGTHIVIVAARLIDQRKGGVCIAEWKKR